jgi:hypothetical protein
MPINPLEPVANISFSQYLPPSTLSGSLHSTCDKPTIIPELTPQTRTFPSRR